MPKYFWWVVCLALALMIGGRVYIFLDEPRAQVQEAPQEEETLPGFDMTGTFEGGRYVVDAETDKNWVVGQIKVHFSQPEKFASSGSLPKDVCELFFEVTDQRNTIHHADSEHWSLAGIQEQEARSFHRNTTLSYFQEEMTKLILMPPEDRLKQEWPEACAAQLNVADTGALINALTFALEQGGVKSPHMSKKFRAFLLEHYRSELAGPERYYRLNDARFWFSAKELGLTPEQLADNSIVH